jgi:hypothetical protein
MRLDEQLIRDACVAASADLGVRVITLFSLANDGRPPVEFIALFPDFGGPKGTVVCHFRDWPSKNPVALQHGYYCSGLHPDSYSGYDRRMFVEALVEWGWHGPGSERPEWCKPTAPPG